MHSKANASLTKPTNVPLLLCALKLPVLLPQDSPISKQSWPLDHDLFIGSTADTVRRLRSHACIALWCGGNEQTPAPDIDAALRELLPGQPGPAPGSPCQAVPRPCRKPAYAAAPCSSIGKVSMAAESRILDATRAYVSGSLWSGFGEGHGVFSDGPYGCQAPAAFFDPTFYKFAFNPEVSPVPGALFWAET